MPHDQKTILRRTRWPQGNQHHHTCRAGRPLGLLIILHITCKTDTPTGTTKVTCPKLLSRSCYLTNTSCTSPSTSPSPSASPTAYPYSTHDGHLSPTKAGLPPTALPPMTAYHTIGSLTYLSPALALSHFVHIILALMGSLPPTQRFCKLLDTIFRGDLLRGAVSSLNGGGFPRKHSQGGMEGNSG